MEDAPDSRAIGRWKASPQRISDPLRAVGRMGAAFSNDRRPIRRRDNLPPVVVGCRRVIVRIGAVNPAGNGAWMHSKTAG